ncbi:MAG: hypothetical protein ACOC78_01860 [Actinomycetota bacterium]
MPPASRNTCASGFQEYLCLENPNETEAVATVTYMFGNGTTSEEQVAVPPRSWATIDVNASAGEGKEMSCKVDSDRAIVVERPLCFEFRGWTGGRDVVGCSD